MRSILSIRIAVFNSHINRRANGSFVSIFLFYVEHQKPQEGQECAVCMDDIDESNYVEYQNSNGIKIMETKSLIDTKWIPCIICETCVEMFIKDMMPNYRKNLLEADCRASQLRVLAQGPPIYVKVALQL